MRTYSLCIISCVLLMSIGHTAFAAGETTEAVGTGMQLLSIIVGLLSRGWTVLAFLAGKLMSNDWVYASGLHLDKVLFVMWNYMKNIANFVLVGYLLANVVKSVVSKSAFNYKSELGKMLLAGILINMSWFLMGSLIDLANIGTAAVGAFPQALVSESVIQEQNFQKLNVSIPSKISIDLENPKGATTPVYDPNNINLDKVRGRTNDMSGPLLFLGASIFRLHDFGKINAEITSVKDFSVALMIKVIVMIMFIAPLAALFVINLKRIFYIWLWVIFAPFIVIFEVLKVGGDKLGKMKDIFSLKEVIGLIFQPVLTIGGMAIVLLLSVSMYYVLGGTPGQSPGAVPVSRTIAGAEISSVAGSSTFYQTQAGTEITFVGDLFSDVADYAGGFVGYLIITAFCIMLMWAVVKMCVSGSKIASSTFNSVIKLTESAVGNFNFIPVGGKRLSLGALGNMGKSVDEVGRSMNAKMATKNTQTISDAFEKSVIGQKVGKAFQFGDQKNHRLNPTMTNDLRREIGRVSSVSGLAQALKPSSVAPLSITNENREYLETVSNEIFNNPGAKGALERALGGIKLNAKEDVLDVKTDTGKKFITFLQQVHNGGVTGEKVDLTNYINVGPTYTIKEGL